MKSRPLRTIVLALACSVFCLEMSAQRIVCDETCKLVDAPPATAAAVSPKPAQAKPAASTKKSTVTLAPVEKEEPGFAVVSPVGRSSVEMIQQAPRLQTLDKKTIAVVGVSFMTKVTHPEIKRLILENYPSAKVLLLDEIGIAGPYPAPGVTRKAKEEFQAKLKEMRVDAVISGNGGCGLCTPKETGSCIAAEYLGIPSVIIAGPGFVDQAKYTALNNGLPIVPPTFEKVESFLKYADMKWDETVAILPIAHRDTKVWHVAVNAVMAGCKPEYMPILIALTKGLGDGNFRRTLASTHAWIPYSWLNGPVARQLGIDSGQGQINEAANIAIGRFMNLALMNLCGYYVKQDRMGTFGYPISWCMVEDDAACLITGDAARNKVQTMPGGGYATVQIELPRAWDKLMAELGYQPLKEFYLH